MKKNTFGKVAVLMGGNSAERKISLMSGKRILKALQDSNIQAFAVDLKENFDRQLQNLVADHVFIALHGKDGEDGIVQAILNSKKIPYTGSGVMASALTMDKVRCKWLWQGIHLPTPSFTLINKNAQPDEVIKTIGLPMVIKPAKEGSSLGVSIVKQKDQLAKAIEGAFQYDNDVIAEKFVDGKEFTVSILGETALPVICIETPHEFYDYQAKYFTDTTTYHIPCGLDKASEDQIQQIALAAFKATGCHGWGRVDFMQDKNGNFWLIEINTIPGMTDHSLVPMAAKAVGISFEELVRRILESTLTI